MKDKEIVEMNQSSSFHLRRLPAELLVTLVVVVMLLLYVGGRIIFIHGLFREAMYGLGNLKAEPHNFCFLSIFHV